MNHDTKQASAEKGAYISIAAYIFLSALKLTVGHIGDSRALWADGLNNTTDIIASLAVLIGLRISRRPPDENHAYGHQRAETIASLVAALIMITVGIQVIYNGFQAIFNHSQGKPDMAAAYTALFSAIFMYAIYRYNVNLSKKTNSASINAVAQDNKADALVSAGAFIGIVGSRFGVGWLDSAAAVIVGVIICKTAWEIFREASHTLIDGFDEPTLRDIHQTIDSVPGVKETSNVRGRMHGNEILLEATIFVEPLLNVVESHRITEEVEDKLRRIHRVTYAIIHIEPFADTKI
ncbi:cation diffusion facilitator family transporter [Peribacillus sp. SCS-155]|uniref:cation diffusion facilitator family transporter n=1 Tax=Peribacillus sedimenti TaxID=3115297 RepID=UPI0039059F2F